MEPIRVTHVGCYRQSQVLKQERPYQALCLMVSGVERWVHRGRVVPHVPPLFYWAPQGEYQELELGPERENWVVIFEGARVELADDPERVRYRDGDHDLLLSRFVPVPRQELPGHRATFAWLRDCALRPDPHARLLAVLGFYRLLGHVAGELTPMSDGRETQGYRSAARRLKELLDDEARLDRSVGELADRCGASRDHLRRLFVKEYGMTPRDYRTQGQVARANRLMMETDLSMKQISGALGFAHHAAFSAAYRRVTGRTPSAVARELRGR